MDVLIIDDDSDDRAIMSEMLQSLLPGISCVAIESGEEAIQYLRQPVTLPHLIFLDINMTGMDGKETLLKIKSMKSYARTKIIMYSGHNDEREKLIYKKLGANGFINKSGSLDKLKTELQTVIAL
jgi:CheY-like chemotaxis protein